MCNCGDIKDEEIQNLSKLEYLDIGFCKKLTDKCLQNLTRLNTLNMCNNIITKNVFDKLLNLKYIYLFNCTKINKKKLKKIKKYKVGKYRDYFVHIVNEKNKKKIKYLHFE